MTTTEREERDPKGALKPDGLPPDIDRAIDELLEGMD